MALRTPSGLMRGARLRFSRNAAVWFSGYAVAFAALLLTLASGNATAQSQVNRCPGNVYSDKPCSGGKPVELDLSANVIPAETRRPTPRVELPRIPDRRVDPDPPVVIVERPPPEIIYVPVRPPYATDWPRRGYGEPRRPEFPRERRPGSRASGGFGDGYRIGPLQPYMGRPDRGVEQPAPSAPPRASYGIRPGSGGAAAPYGGMRQPAPASRPSAGIRQSAPAR